jgi:alpha-L-fucosidase
MNDGGVPGLMRFPRDRTRWFEEARFGLFVHWGLYALLGRGEWVLNRERIPLDEYGELAGRFDASEFRPRDWARMAGEAGMKYAVLTTKHHEGFCLWDSAVCAFNAARSAARRDLVAEYVEAMRAGGLKVGFYYSLGDWFNPDWTLGWQGDAAARERFMDYTHALVRELLTGYGVIDILWYDLPQCYSAAEWRAVELNAMARALQPGILINNRAMTTEDFRTPEQHVSAAPRGRMWEACMTLNGHWGYCPGDTHYKSPREVVRNLASAAAGGGNLLLNVGPDGKGAIPVRSQEILREVGRWLEVNGESIYASERHDLPFNLWGPVTVRGHVMYLHLQEDFGSTLTIGGLTRKPVSARLLAGGIDLAIEQRGARTFLHGLPPQTGAMPAVVRLELDGPPDQDIGRVIGGADIFPNFPP